MGTGQQTRVGPGAAGPLPHRTEGWLCSRKRLGSGFRWLVYTALACTATTSIALSVATAMSQLSTYRPCTWLNCAGRSWWQWVSRVCFRCRRSTPSCSPQCNANVTSSSAASALVHPTFAPIWEACLCGLPCRQHGCPGCAHTPDHQAAQQQAGAVVGVEGMVSIRVAGMQDGEAQQVQVAGGQGPGGAGQDVRGRGRGGAGQGRGCLLWPPPGAAKRGAAHNVIPLLT